MLGDKKRKDPNASAFESLLSNPGSVLLSHTASRAVPSAPRSLTSEFGKGSGVASSRSPPETVGSFRPVQGPTKGRDSRSESRARHFEVCLRDTVKPHGLLVPVSSA